MSRRRAAREDNLELSRLDVIANALGAVLLLFLIMSAATRPSAKGRGGGATPYLIAHWEVQDCPNALLNVRLSHTGAGSKLELVDLPLESFDARTGKMKARSSWWSGPEELLLLGFRREASSTPPAGEPTRRTFRLVVLNPRSGDWTATVRYMSRSGIDNSWQSECPAIRVTRRLLIAGLPPSDPIGPVSVNFGDVAEFPKATVPSG